MIKNKINHCFLISDMEKTRIFVFSMKLSNVFSNAIAYKDRIFENVL